LPLIVDSWAIGLVRYTLLTANQVNLFKHFLIQQLQLPWKSNQMATTNGQDHSSLW